MKSVITLHKLSKKYTIYHEAQSAYSTLVETLTLKAKAAAKRCRRMIRGDFSKSPANFEDFWALSDVDFNIEEGDRIGIIGRNGAGKSTLLKLISRITHPTKGSIEIKGSVASLLEVGTGFHMELTGRENIFLNGSILGMKHREIQNKFDEIVAFSEIEQFLDTPVKRYSSGMFTRLGFAIAAHLDPEILIIDEVLAVGDAKFQEKCLKKLKDLGSAGRTVIFVSHDIGSVLSLCTKGLYLEKGRVKYAGDIEGCANAYMKDIEHNATNWKGDIGDEHIRFTGVNINLVEDTRKYFYQGEPIKVTIEYELLKPDRDLYAGIVLTNTRNQILATSYTHDLQQANPFELIGKNKLTFTIDSNILYEGDYLLKLSSAISYKKHITTDEITLKLQVFQKDKNTRATHNTVKGGIYLGNNWC